MPRNHLTQDAPPAQADALAAALSKLAADLLTPAPVARWLAALASPEADRAHEAGRPAEAATPAR